MTGTACNLSHVWSILVGNICKSHYHIEAWTSFGHFIFPRIKSSYQNPSSTKANLVFSRIEMSRRPQSSETVAQILGPTRSLLYLSSDTLNRTAMGQIVPKAAENVPTGDCEECHRPFAGRGKILKRYTEVCPNKWCNHGWLPCPGEADLQGCAQIVPVNKDGRLCAICNGFRVVEHEGCCGGEKVVVYCTGVGGRHEKFSEDSD